MVCAEVHVKAVLQWLISFGTKVAFTLLLDILSEAVQQLFTLGVSHVCNLCLHRYVSYGLKGIFASLAVCGVTKVLCA